MADDELYMRRCLQLASLGAGSTAPNPMVGAVLVHGARIIGEGWHRQYGHAHAEVNCIDSLAEEDRQFISSSTMYVSLEPCTHYGKTPPCADLIIRHKIPKVVVGCRDPFKEVNGKGIEKLKAAGVQVVVGVLQDECGNLNRRFFTFYTRHRPYIVLKWAQTADGRMASPHPLKGGAKEVSNRLLVTNAGSPQPLKGGVGGERLLITNAITNKLVHKWRSEEAGILVGTNTALIDDPALDNRLWYGPAPVRLVVDMDLSLPHGLRLFNGPQKTIVFNILKHEERGNVLYYQVGEDASLVHQIMNACYQNRILSVLVEGGARTLQSFIDEGLWDEARVLTNESLFIGEGLPAPKLTHFRFTGSENILNNKLNYFVKTDADLDGFLG